jgi:hypothetical protein
MEGRGDETSFKNEKVELHCDPSLILILIIIPGARRVEFSDRIGYNN